MTPPAQTGRRLLWIAAAAIGLLLVFPAARALFAAQVRTEALRYSGRPDPAEERAAAERLRGDYPVQLAVAARLSPTGSMEESRARARRILALADRFPNNPSVYANALRFMTMGEVQVNRDTPAPVSVRPGSVRYETPADSLALFDSAAQRGAALDPTNAYFPMMRAVGLFAGHHDAEGLAALETAGRCTVWREYYQDEFTGAMRLRRAVEGEPTALTTAIAASSILFPQYASMRAAARCAVQLLFEHQARAAAADTADRNIALRHALMRCGGLMRSQGASYITSLVGIAITSVAITTPAGIPDPDSAGRSLPASRDRNATRDQQRSRYYDFLNHAGRPDEAAWAKTELAAGDLAREYGSAALARPELNTDDLRRLGALWVVSIALLSSSLILMLLGTTAHLASGVRPRRYAGLWRLLFGLLFLAGIGAWQLQVARLAVAPGIEIQGLLAQWPDDRNYTAIAVQSLCLGAAALVPLLLIGLILGLSALNKVPPATGLGRGLRGVAVPAAVVVFVAYGAALLPTARLEARIKSQVKRTTASEPGYFAAVLGKPWPGDPLP